MAVTRQRKLSLALYTLNDDDCATEYALTFALMYDNMCTEARVRWRYRVTVEKWKKFWLSQFVADFSPNSTWLVTSRFETTRYLAHAFWHREKSWRDVTCRGVSRLSDSMAQHAGHDKRDRRDSHNTCLGRRYSVDRGGHVHFSFSRSCSWDWCKSKAKKNH